MMRVASDTSNVRSTVWNLTRASAATIKHVRGFRIISGGLLRLLETTGCGFSAGVARSLGQPHIRALGTG
jgi:hypothetical protein